MNQNQNNSEIILYQPDSSIRLEVLLYEDNVWLNRQQIADLFHRDIKTIGKHIQNAKAEELKGISTVANFATVQKEGNRLINRKKEFFNLDMILSVGYRVKSPQGVMFRRWANTVLKDYLLRGYAVNQRIERLEQRVSKTEEQVDFFVRTALPPVEGVFYNGQIFDAYASSSSTTPSITSARPSKTWEKSCSRSAEWRLRRRCCRGQRFPALLPHAILNKRNPGIARAEGGGNRNAPQGPKISENQVLKLNNHQNKL